MSYPVSRLCAPGAQGDRVGSVRALEDALVRAFVRLGVADAHRVDDTGVTRPSWAPACSSRFAFSSARRARVPSKVTWRDTIGSLALR